MSIEDSLQLSVGDDVVIQDVETIKMEAGKCSLLTDAVSSNPEAIVKTFASFVSGMEGYCGSTARVYSIVENAYAPGERCFRLKDDERHIPFAFDRFMLAQPKHQASPDVENEVDNLFGELL